MKIILKKKRSVLKHACKDSFKGHNVWMATILLSIQQHCFESQYVCMPIILILKEG